MGGQRGRPAPECKMVQRAEPPWPDGLTPGPARWPEKDGERWRQRPKALGSAGFSGAEDVGAGAAGSWAVLQASPHCAGQGLGWLGWHGRGLGVAPARARGAMAPAPPHRVPSIPEWRWGHATRPSTALKWCLWDQKGSPPKNRRASISGHPHPGAPGFAGGAMAAKWGRTAAPGGRSGGAGGEAEPGRRSRCRWARRRCRSWLGLQL